jgi:arylsulfatase
MYRASPPRRRLRRAVPLAVALAPVALALGACRGPGSQEPPRHVFLITVDTLRADRMGYHGYPRETTPFLDGLAARSVVFERAIAQWPKTGPSLASLFTGQYPLTTGLTHKAAIRIPEEYLTLPELFARSGYTALAVVSNGVLGQHLGWDAGFAEYRETWKLVPEPSDDPVLYRKYLNARRVNELALPLLEAHRDAERLFVWLHYSDPHAPYLLPEDAVNRFLDDPWYRGTELARFEADDRATRLGDHQELRYYVAQYDANVRFVDDHVAQVFGRARELGLLDDALVVFTADHGESLGEHDYYFGHGRLPHNAGSHVPLFVHWPGRLGAGRRVAQPVELVDLYPTLQALALPGTRPVPGLEGKSLLPLLRPAEPAAEDLAPFQLAFSQAGGGSPTTHFRSVQDRDWKLVYHPPVRGGKTERPASYELYHLAQDPGETRDLFDPDNEHEDQRRLRRHLFLWMGEDNAHWIRRDKNAIDSQSEETRRALIALGYAE